MLSPRPCAQLTVQYAEGVFLWLRGCNTLCVLILLALLQENSQVLAARAYGGRLLRSITEEGAAALAEVVNRSHLKELNIYMNDIGDGGALKARWPYQGL